MGGSFAFRSLLVPAILITGLLAGDCFDFSQRTLETYNYVPPNLDVVDQETIRQAPEALDRALKAEQARARAEATGEPEEADLGVELLPDDPKMHYTRFAVRVASGFPNSLEDDQAAIRATANAMNVDLASASPEDIARVRQQVREGWILAVDALIRKPPSGKPVEVERLKAQKCALLAVSRTSGQPLSPVLQQFENDCR